MVWGGMCWNGLTELVFVEKGKKINAAAYVDATLEPAISKLHKRTKTRSTSVVTRRLFPNPTKFIFQQDGATPHSAQSTQKWLTENVHSFVPKSEWPGNSPDLNPIENLWAIMVENVARKEPHNLEDLKEEITKEWEKLSRNFLENLIFSMPKRMAQVLQKKGGKISY